MYLFIKYRENRLILWVAINSICGAWAGLQTLVEKRRVRQGHCMCIGNEIDYTKNRH